MIADSVGLLRAVDWLPVFMALIVPLALWIYGGPVLDLLGFLPGGRRALWRRRRRR
jgi:hypothetical protein